MEPKASLWGSCVGHEVAARGAEEAVPAFLASSGSRLLRVLGERMKEKPGWDWQTRREQSSQEELGLCQNQEDREQGEK